MNHPEILDLELLRTGEAEPAVARHVEQCDECRATLGDLERLAAAAQGLPAGLEIPDDVDGRILWQARKRAWWIRRGGRRGWTVPTWRVAAAAVAVLGLVATWRALDAPWRRRAHAEVTMLDALRVARAVDAGTAEARWDWTGDGLVDRRDIDVIALRAVAMEDRR